MIHQKNGYVTPANVKLMLLKIMFSRWKILRLYFMASQPHLCCYLQGRCLPICRLDISIDYNIIWLDRKPFPPPRMNNLCQFETRRIPLFGTMWSGHPAFPQPAMAASWPGPTGFQVGSLVVMVMDETFIWMLDLHPWKVDGWGKLAPDVDTAWSTAPTIHMGFWTSKEFILASSI